MYFDTYLKGFHPVEYYSSISFKICALHYRRKRISIQQILTVGLAIRTILFSY